MEKKLKYKILIELLKFYESRNDFQLLNYTCKTVMNKNEVINQYNNIDNLMESLGDMADLQINEYEESLNSKYIKQDDESIKRSVKNREN